MIEESNTMVVLDPSKVATAERPLAADSARVPVVASASSSSSSSSCENIPISGPYVQPLNDEVRCSIFFSISVWLTEETCLQTFPFNMPLFR